MILGYIAEHSLPLSSADSLKNLIQEAPRDPQSLSGLSLSKQTAVSTAEVYRVFFSPMLKNNVATLYLSYL